MRLKNIDFNQPPRLLIDSVEYICENRFEVTDHVFNNSGVALKLNSIYPASYSKEDLINKPFKLKHYALVEFYFGQELFFKGFVKKQSNATLNPFQPKWLNIQAVSLKEWLTQKPVDFSVLKQGYDWVADKVISALNYPIIKKGKYQFTNSGIITAYNAQNKSAYDVLKLVQNHSNTALITKLESDGKLSINYYDRDSILNGTAGNKGVDIVYDTEQSQKNFWELYGITQLDWQESNSKDANFVRVESEKVVSTQSRFIEIDLQKSGETFTLEFPVGSLDIQKTQLLDANGQLVRKISISESSFQKPSDLIYTSNNQTLKLNPRLLGKNQKLKVVYYPVFRNYVDSQDVQHQTQLASRTETDGKLMRYEKHNDISTTADLLNMSERYLKVGVASKEMLVISSQEPIWDIGEHCEFKGDSNIPLMKDITDSYIVREANLNLIFDNEGSINKSITYKLSRTFDLENEYNYHDSLAYRDNPLMNLDSVQIDKSDTIQTGLYVVGTNLDKECITFTEDELLTFGLEETLEGTLDSDVADATLAKVKYERLDI